MKPGIPLSTPHNHCPCIMKLLPIAAALAFCACVTPSTHEGLPVLHALSSVPVEYTARLAADGPGEFGEWEPGGDEEAAGNPLQIETRMELIEVSNEIATLMVPAEESTGMGRLVERPATEALGAQLREADDSGQTIAFPHIVTNSGQRGTISIQNQQAFISGFEVTMTQQQPWSMMADPVVSVAEDGTFVELRARASSAGSVNLDVDLRMAQANMPMGTAEVRLPGTHVPVTIQTPCFITQSVQTQASLSPDQALVLGPWPALRQGHSMVAIVTTQVINPYGGEKGNMNGAGLELVISQGSEDGSGKRLEKPSRQPAQLP